MMVIRARIMMFFTFLYGAATIFLGVSGHGTGGQVLIGVCVTGFFFVLWRRCSLEAWVAASSAAVQPEDGPKAEKPMEPVMKKCPPHDWNVLPEGGHRCKLCNYKAGVS